MTKYTTILFDLDGTLLNSLEDLTDSVNYALTTMQFSPRTLEQIRTFVGNGVQRLMERAVPIDTPEKELLACLEIMRTHYSNNMRNKTRPYDGIYEMLAELKTQNCKIAVISNKYDQAVKALCKELFADYLDLAIGESETIAKKPDPAGVLAAITTLNAEKSSTLYIGDSEVDIQTAKNADITSVGVTWGFRDRTILEKNRANYIIDKPAELLAIIN